MKDVMSIKELTEYLGIGKSKIYEMIKQGKIPASKIGRQYKFSKDVIDQWLRERIVTRREPVEKTLFDLAGREPEKTILPVKKTGDNAQ